MTRITGQRQDQFLAHLSVAFNGQTVDCGYWDAHEGGDIEIESSNTKVSGGITVQLGGSRSVSSIKLTRLDRIDLATQYDFIRAAAGEGVATTALYRRDKSGNATGAPFMHVGVVGNVPLVAYDENSTDPAKQEVNIDVDAS